MRKYGRKKYKFGAHYEFVVRFEMDGYKRANHCFDWSQAYRTCLTLSEMSIAWQIIRLSDDIELARSK